MAEDLKVEDAPDDRDMEAEYALEYDVTCPFCGEKLKTLQVVRLLRSRVNFTSTLAAARARHRLPRVQEDHLGRAGRVRVGPVPGAGPTCLLVLAEWHAVLHTWPETGTRRARVGAPDAIIPVEPAAAARSIRPL